MVSVNLEWVRVLLSLNKTSIVNLLKIVIKKFPMINSKYRQQFEIRVLGFAGQGYGCLATRHLSTHACCYARSKYARSVSRDFLYLVSLFSPKIGENGFWTRAYNIICARFSSLQNKFVLKSRWKGHFLLEQSQTVALFVMIVAGKFSTRKPQNRNHML